MDENNTESRQWDHIDFYVADVFISALVNGDETALDSRETRAVRTFELDQIRLGSHWQPEDHSETFARCEVTGLMAECSKIRLVFPVSTDA